ncbi:hypothetical protein GTV32_21345 [Gordonia sp. SID5947]|uniref:hypothetical protein n=1 Tax=Gordonia sp. SID5947 TaxID=2690315 RepID=UPI00136C995B|nr:hypothetical protein [Gordonia sp. SID5947]MYR08696.1 hypothetical protein [Gordonia sp. SID5947]
MSIFDTRIVESGVERIRRFADEHVEPRRRGDTIDTYRNIRVGLVSLVLMLGVAIAVDSIEAGRIESSISRYYYTSVHAVFIGALCATGAMLMAYKGRSEVEDVLLNYAGFLAFLVAFIPTPVGSPPPGFTSPDWVRWNVWAAFAATAAGLVLWFVFGRLRGYASSPHRTWAGIVARGLGVLAVILVLVRLSGHWTWIPGSTHDVAAVSMFIGLILVVFFNGLAALADRGADDVHSWYPWAYAVIAAVMALTLLGIICVHSASQSWVFWVEVALLAEFATFWVVQTLELWDDEESAALVERQDAEQRPEDDR